MCGVSDLNAAAAASAPIVDPRIAVRPSHLADGRELIYFDDADTTLPAERGIDERALDPRPANAHMRQDPLTGEWISIAAARQALGGVISRLSRAGFPAPRRRSRT